MLQKIGAKQNDRFSTKLQFGGKLLKVLTLFFVLTLLFKITRCLTFRINRKHHRKFLCLISAVRACHLFSNNYWRHSSANLSDIFNLTWFPISWHKIRQQSAPSAPPLICFLLMPVVVRQLYTFPMAVIFRMKDRNHAPGGDTLPQWLTDQQRRESCMLCLYCCWRNSSNCSTESKRVVSVAVVLYTFIPSTSTTTTILYIHHQSADEHEWGFSFVNLPVESYRASSRPVYAIKLFVIIHFPSILKNRLV